MPHLAEGGKCICSRAGAMYFCPYGSKIAFLVGNEVLCSRSGASSCPEQLHRFVALEEVEERF